ncbi:hypothetical protein BT63DRAFT_416665 [Microthyrium microscopicum]|uniref:Uncharacterized protein n=1 Tax=Microthyrium microscopicum TaxID=703497 RepID=A0A6A6U3V4_9PEZI|nr:hypothetical protein BT63DRAFT_416665 [Microthyrium microscopicum]
MVPKKAATAATAGRKTRSATKKNPAQESDDEYDAVSDAQDDDTQKSASASSCESDAPSGKRKKSTAKKKDMPVAKKQKKSKPKVAAARPRQTPAVVSKDHTLEELPQKDPKNVFTEKWRSLREQISVIKVVEPTPLKEPAVLMRELINSELPARRKFYLPQDGIVKREVQVNYDPGDEDLTHEAKGSEIEEMKRKFEEAGSVRWDIDSIV